MTIHHTFVTANSKEFYHSFSFLSTPDESDMSGFIDDLPPSPNSSSDVSQDYYNSMYRPYAANKSPSESQGSKFKSPTFRFGHYKTYPTVPKSTPVASKKNTLVDPDVIMLGRDALDRELNCLYQHRSTGQFRLVLPFYHVYIYCLFV